MKYFLLLIQVLALSIVSYYSSAQPINPLVKKLSKPQQWLIQKQKNFIKSNHLKVDTAVLFRQIERSYLGGCNPTCYTALPVNKLELKGARLSNTQVKLDFYTLSETMNKGFIIERTFRSGSNDFDSVGFVAGRGNYNMRSDYTFVDQNYYDGITYYRLRQIDLDNRNQFSNIIKVDGYVSPIAIKIFPNPVSGSYINVQIIGFGNNEGISLLVLDVKGSIIYKQENINLVNENYRIDNLNIAPGYYRIKAFNKAQSVIGSFIKK